MRPVFKTIICLSLALLISGCLTRSLNLQEGITSFKTQDYRRAFIRLKPEAEKGQPDAQYAVGYMYYYGQGVIEDRKKAWFWINMAAHLGQKDAVAAKQILEQKGMQNREVFASENLQHYPVNKGMY